MSSHDQEDLNFDLENHLKTPEESVKVETEEEHEGYGVADTMEEISEADQDGINMFNCDKCEFSTKSKTSLDSHKDSVHDGVKKYKCDQCDYATAWPSNLNKHKKGVHEKIRLQCDECDFMTTNHGILKKHMNNVHKKERTKRRKGAAVRQLLKCDHCNVSIPIRFASLMMSCKVKMFKGDASLGKIRKIIEHHLFLLRFYHFMSTAHLCGMTCKRD